MTAGKSIALALGLAAVLGAGAPALAGGHGCRGEEVHCYKKVRLPDVYQNVERPVMLRPATKRVVHVPPVVGTRLEREVVAPGRAHAVHVPPVYSTIVRRELVQPGTVGYRVTPPVVETVHPGRTRWVTYRDRYGQTIRCPKKSPPVTRTIARDVVVDPGQRVPVFTPPIYADVPRTVLVRPAGVRHVYQPPVTRFVERPVVLRPAQRHVVVEPPVYGVARHAVKVRSGGYAWRPIRAHH
jgi:hypothetical protein